MIPLYTTATAYPWYKTLAALHMPALKPKGHTIGIVLDAPAAAGSVVPSSEPDFHYRYAVFRAGIFHRWEDTTDAKLVATERTSTATTITTTPVTAASASTTTGAHTLPLKLLRAGETYVVDDVLGVCDRHPDIYHKRVPTQPGDTLQYVDVVHEAQQTAAAAKASSGKKKKGVGFAPEPESYAHRPHPAQQQQQQLHPQHTPPPPKGEPVHLNSTDGLVVVSAFLPVVVHRSETSMEPTWTADWDYEALLSMQTHLRVTRIGVVKWKGWHGNWGVDTTATSSSSSKEPVGVPINERHLVEECLRPFNCVPVWIEPLLFGEM